MLWEDLYHIREGLGMSDQYHVALTPLMIGWIVVIVACTVLLFFLGKGRPKVVPRLIALAAVVAVGAVSFFYVYLDDDRYNALPGTTPRRRWRPTPPPGWSTPSSTA